MSEQYDTSTAAGQAVVLYDGSCGFCRCSVSAIIRRDPGHQFRFVPLTSPVGKSLLARHGMDPDRSDTVVLVEGAAAYTHSTAVLRIARRLTFPMRLLWIGIAVPRPLRDLLYTGVAKSRSRLSGLLPPCHPERAAPQRFGA